MEDERTHVVVTGAGVYTPIGTTVESLRHHLRAGDGGIDQIETFDTEDLRVQHAAEIPDYDPLDHFTEAEAEHLDRTAQFGVLAAEECLNDADLDLSAHDGVGLVAGICAGGRGDDDVTLGETLPWTSRENALDFFRTWQPPQTNALARWFDLTGPTATVSTACASSNSALTYAYDLLQAGRTDVALVGGADAFSPTTYAGFYALQAMAEEPSAPFSTPIGVSFGEAAGFLVLETAEHARERNAQIRGELLGTGATGDAYHITSPHPSGEGLQRAMEQALDTAGLAPDDVDYVNAHGTGTRGNDSAETLAIRGVFDEDDSDPPPTSSTKSAYGHTLGAAGILEFISALVGVEDDFLPPTLNFDEPRPGCDLDYVPNEARDASASVFVNNSAAFGGVNSSVVGGEPALDRDLPPRPVDDVVLTGCGVISPIGHNFGDFLDGLRTGTRGTAPIDDADLPDEIARGGQVTDLQPRRLVPSIRTRRLDPVSTYATTATGLALDQAGLQDDGVSDERIGVVMGLSRGPITTQEDFLHDMRTRGLEGLSAKHFPAMVVSTIGGKVAKTFQLRGLNSMIVEGITSGLHALVRGATRLQQDDSLDAVVVIAADELGAMGLRLYDRLGILSYNGFSPYGTLEEHLMPCGCSTDVLQDDALAAGVPEAAASAGSGFVLGEGAVAVVLERRASAEDRGATPHGRLAGTGLTSDGRSALQPDGLRRASEHAMTDADIEPASVDAVYGHGRGAAAYDGREVAALDAVFDAPVPAGCVNGNTGVAEAASGLYSIAAALGSLRNDEVYPLVTDDAPADTGPLRFDSALRTPSVDRVMVSGASEGGVNASVVLTAA